MKFLKSRKIKSLIIIPVILIVLLNVFVPTKVNATSSKEGIGWSIIDKNIGGLKALIGLDTSLSGDVTWDFAPGNSIKEIMYLLTGLGDVIIALLQVVLVGDYDFWFSTTITNINDNLDNPESWLYADIEDVKALEDGRIKDARGNMLIYSSDGGLSGGILGDWEVPNIIYCPENIFSNKIAALDANFINPNKYNAVTNTSIWIFETDEGEKEAVSFASAISPTIATWYRAFRNLAIVGLLIILVYTGIRIVIGSTAGEKAKYKERIQDWLVAFCLVFFMHFIMTAIMAFTDSLINLFDESVNSGIIVYVDDGTIFRTNFTGYVRFAAQSASWKESLGYGIMYVMIIGIIVRYTWIYLRRFFFLAFFTMIAPLMALVYPLDKMSDGKAQAFNKWFKEYVVLALTQPMHLILYSSLISSATTLCVKNPIYAIAVMMFISTAEKWVKKLFRMDEAQLTSTTLGDVAMLGAIAGIGKKVIGGAVSTVTNVAKKGATAAAIAATGGTAAPLVGALGATGGAAAAAGGATTAATGLLGGAGASAVAAEGAAGGVTSAVTGLLGGTGTTTATGVAGEVLQAGTDVAGSLIEGTGSLGENILESGDIYGMQDSLEADGQSMSTEGIRNRLNVQNISSNDDYYNNEGSEQGINSESEENNGIGAGAGTQDFQNSNLTDVIARGVQLGMATAFEAKDAKDKQEQEKEKEKQKIEKEKRDFIDASMQETWKNDWKTKLARGAIKTTMTAGGALVGGVIGLGLGAGKGEDYGKLATLGASSVAGFSHNLTSETIGSYLDVFKEKKRKNLEAILAVTPQEDMQDEQKAQMMRKVAGMGTRKEWNENRVVETYTYAASPEFKNLATDSDAMNRFERYMRSSTEYTQSKMEEMKKDIIEAQKVNRKIKGAR